MVTVHQIDTTSKRQVNRFVNLPFALYAGRPQWVPLLSLEARAYLDRRKFPFYNHSQADFFIAARNGRDIGRLAVLEHRPFNAYHGTRQAQFYFFECLPDQEAALALFDCAGAWARSRGLDTLIGPKGFGLLDSFGVLIQGFEHRQMMSLTAYNPAYYAGLLEGCGFSQVVDFISCRLAADTFRLPPWLPALAESVRRKEELTVETFSRLKDLTAAAPQMLQVYNEAFTANWEYYPLPEAEIKQVIAALKLIAVPQLMKVIKRKQEISGFLFALPDLSPALQRAQGRLTPLTIFHLLREKRRLQSIVLGGVAILDRYRLKGGNALLIAEIEKTMRETGVRSVELVNIADTAVQMRRDLAALGLHPHKIHRVYERKT